MFYWGKTMINIQDIIPFMKKGWVAMDKSRCWWWFSNKPVLVEDDNIVKNMWIDYMALQYRLDCFDIAPADDWTKSLIKVGGK